METFLDGKCILPMTTLRTVAARTTEGLLPSLSDLMLLPARSDGRAGWRGSKGKSREWESGEPHPGPAQQCQCARCRLVHSEHGEVFASRSLSPALELQTTTPEQVCTREDSRRVTV